MGGGNGSLWPNGKHPVDRRDELDGEQRSAMERGRIGTVCSEPISEPV